MPDYQYETECLAHVTETLLHLKQFIEDNVVEYPPAMTVYMTVLYGLIPSFQVKCKKAKGGICRVSGGQPCGGIADIFDVLDEALECIDLELDMEAPPYQYPADYQI